MAEKIVLTKQKIDSLKAELEKLVKEKRKELSQSLEQARLSDVSEDTDDIVAVMSELEKVDQRINEIKEILSNSKELNKENCSPGKVEIGSTVKLKNNNKTTTFHIVSEIEADPSANKISDKSPLGKELLKAKVGDCVKIRVGLRKVEYKVLDIC
jgi:transcription elongation factor GreA